MGFELVSMRRPVSKRLEEAGESPYPTPLAHIRKKEYPALQATTYLDHAGTTPPPQSAINAFAKDLNSNLFGNPHSASPASKLSTERVERVRRQMLTFFKADPEHFDLIFVANATAAVKLAIECVTDYSLELKRGQTGQGFWYGYHRDCHTSLVGPREVAHMSRYFSEDAEVERWLSSPDIGFEASVGIFAYPAQSNMNGRRLPLHWPGRLRRSRHPGHQNIYSLLDAAAYVATAQLDLSDVDTAPDLTALSFYKIFGFPNLGALIVRKAVGHVLSLRRYLGGGTVDMVVNSSNPEQAWHARKQSSLHEMLEDGSPPFHTILALDSALDIHKSLYGSMAKISQHTSYLIEILYKEIIALTYVDGKSVCKVYRDASSTHGDRKRQGPTVSFNVKTSGGRWIGKSQFEREAIAANIQLRTGGVCNPGGVASALDLSPLEMRESFAEGVRCGNDVDEMHGKPTGIIRVSLGAMSNLEDVRRFLKFLTTFASTHGGQAVSLPFASQQVVPFVNELPTSEALCPSLSKRAHRDDGTPVADSSTSHSVRRDKEASVLTRETLSASPTLDQKAEGRKPTNGKESSNRSPMWKKFRCVGWRLDTQQSLA